MKPNFKRIAIQFGGDYSDKTNALSIILEKMYNRGFEDGENFVWEEASMNDLLYELEKEENMHLGTRDAKKT